MKAFYSPDLAVPHSTEYAADYVVAAATPLYTHARVAVYEAPLAAPRVEEVPSCAPNEYIEAISSRVYELARDQGGTIPYTVVREVAENLIHAAFSEPVVSVLDNGNTIRFADQGPGIADKDKAVMPGFTTATGAMKQHIRGVGSGLPIVRDYLSVSGGNLLIEDNLGCGSVVTISGCRSELTPSIPSSARAGSSAPAGPQQELVFGEQADVDVSCSPRLTNRQKQVLAIVMESGSAGPSLVSRELAVGISTAYRDLASLEDLGLINSDGGKRALTERGMLYLDDLIAGS